MASEGFKLVERLELDPDRDYILEVGTGVSTSYLSQYGHVFTMDIEPPSKRYPQVTYFVGRAEDMIAMLNVTFMFAWLDGHDWPFPEIGEQELAIYRARYEARGQKLTCEASRESHLEITIRLLPLMHHAGMIVFDDTWWTGSGFNGKGGLAVPYLLQQGCSVFSMSSDDPTSSYVAVYVR